MDGMIKVTDIFTEGAALLDKIARRAGNTVGLMGECAGIMHDEIEENFDQEGRPAKWQKLKSSTIRQRRAKGHWPGKILQVKGRLANSFQERHDNNNAIVGTNVAYARPLHFGATIRHQARMRILHFDQRKSGKMTHSRPGTGDRFTRSSKAKYGMKVQGKAYGVTLPPRPILYIGHGGIQRIIDAGKAWLTKN
jgi:phage virion morphogenesis protein